MLTAARQKRQEREVGPHYKWVALSNTTLGILMVTINSSIVLIALPDIFRGISLDPLAPGSSPYFLWMLMGFMVVTAVLVVSFGRIGDIYGRVRMYNLGFAVFTLFSVMLSLTWMTGTNGALWLIVMRIFQGVGGALLFANSSAILTDAFPGDQRGLALGINMVAAITGSFIGLVLGGVLGPVSWRLVFLVSVPFGLFGTLWAYLQLRDTGIRQPSRIDWWGNLTFAVGLVSILVAITYGILPYGGHTMGWTNPLVLTALFGGVAVLGIFAWVETKVPLPMFRMHLFRIRPFAAGNIATLMSALARGGLMFIMIIWLQGIWLPQHGYSFANTPLWAGVYMLPLTGGFLAAAPISGFLSDRFGARPFSTGGMIGAAGTFALFETLPANFHYVWFGLLLFLYGFCSGLFSAPNQAGIMNSLPAEERGAGAGMAATFQNSALVLSIGIFFTLIILGLSSSLSGHLQQGLLAQGVPPATAAKAAHVPAVGSLFAAFLGYNPIGNLLGPAVHQLPAAKASYLTGRAFFPQLISAPFMDGLRKAFDFAIVACLLASVASWMRGGRYVHVDVEAAAEASGLPAPDEDGVVGGGTATDGPAPDGSASGVPSSGGTAAGSAGGNGTPPDGKLSPAAR